MKRDSWPIQEIKNIYEMSQRFVSLKDYIY